MLNPLLDDLTDYPFQRLRELLYGLEPGQPPLVMSIGEPKISPPAFIDAIIAGAREDWGRYPPMNGTPELNSAIADWLTRRYDLPNGMIDPDRHILPVSGTREGLYMVGQLTVPPAGDGPRPAVLFPNPFYQAYVGAGVMAGAEVVPVTAGPATGFLPDYAALDPALLARTRAAFICSPANPQGVVAGLDYLKAMIKLARAHRFVLVSDECYSEIYYDAPPPGLLQACAELGEGLDGVLVFNSLSKRSGCPGLRSGFVAGDPVLIKAFGRLRAYGGAALPGPVMAASAALWCDEAHVKESLELYRSNMQVAEDILSGTFGFTRPAGGFFLWLDVGDGEATARALWAKAGLRVLPGAYLARPDGAGVTPGRAYIRVALVHDRETTAKALQRLKETLAGS